MNEFVCMTLKPDSAYPPSWRGSTSFLPIYVQIVSRYPYFETMGENLGVGPGSISQLGNKDRTDGAPGVPGAARHPETGSGRLPCVVPRPREPLNSTGVSAHRITGWLCNPRMLRFSLTDCGVSINHLGSLSDTEAAVMEAKALD